MSSQAGFLVVNAIEVDGNEKFVAVLRDGVRILKSSGGLSEREMRALLRGSYKESETTIDLRIKQARQSSSK